MEHRYYQRLMGQSIPSPCFVVDTALLKKNVSIIDSIQKQSGCRILLALKAFSMFRSFPYIKDSLWGTCASSPYEARLGFEEFGKDVHTFAAAYSSNDIYELTHTSTHIVFNSFSQFQRFKSRLLNTKRNIQMGLRVNPEHSEGHTPIYDPCNKGSRLGIVEKDFNNQSLDGISGLHFHTLCEHNADALKRTLAIFEQKFSKFFPHLSWVNFGGGHLVTKEDYDIELLLSLLLKFNKKYNLQIYLEPGEAIVYNTGYLIAEVLDIVTNENTIAILNTSAVAHMPDVIEMPYRPMIFGASHPGKRKYTYQLAGMSCLAGDIIGSYSFDQPLSVGSRLVFMDMAHYTMVKTNFFNGLKHPALVLYDSEANALISVKEFQYSDFRTRLS